MDRAALEGEAAVALLVGGEADFRQRPGGDEGYDLLVGDLRVEVKHTRHRGGGSSSAPTRSTQTSWCSRPRDDTGG